MDILRKELNALYASQRLGDENLDGAEVAAAVSRMRDYAAVGGGCCVVTDAAADRSYIVGGAFCRILGLTDGEGLNKEVASSDEDEIYARLHPEDLVDKRMLEYEFFKRVDALSGNDKLRLKAACTIRIKDRQGNYIAVANTTQILRLSPAGKIWLILCCYDLSPTAWGGGIQPRILNNATGDVASIATCDRRRHILTPREREVLALVGEGLPSKCIADRLAISIHTVSRHRQNIIEKLSCGNMTEAYAAAALMNLL